MRTWKLLGLLACGIAVAQSSFASPDRQVLSVTTGTNETATVSATNTVIRGTVDELFIDVVTAGSTGNVSVTYYPDVVGLTAGVSLYSASSVGSDKYLRPRLDGTDASGNALTSDPPWPVTVCGGSIVFSVASANATNRTFKAVVIYDRN